MKRNDRAAINKIDLTTHCVRKGNSMHVENNAKTLGNLKKS